MHIKRLLTFCSLWLLCLHSLPAFSRSDTSQLYSPPVSRESVERNIDRVGATNTISRVLHVSSMTDDDSTRLRLGDFIRIRVSNLPEVLRDYRRKPDDLRLFLNDIEFKSTPPVSVDTANGTVVFKLQRHTVTEGFWQMFYRLPYVYEHPSRIGLGFADTQIADPYPSAGKLSLVLIREQYLILGCGFILLFAAIMFWMSRKQRLVREDWSSQHKASGFNFHTIPFSMAKTQLAFWTFLIISGFFLIWLVTGELAEIPSSILALLGISLTSHLVSKGINQNQDSKSEVRHQDHPSNGFFTDILNDENGLSIPRLQFFLFNLVIGGSFVRDVVKNWSFPDFGATTLALLSISGAGYLIVKTSENGPGAATPISSTVNNTSGIKPSGMPATTVVKPPVSPVKVNVTSNNAPSVISSTENADAISTPDNSADMDNVSTMERDESYYREEKG